MAETLTAALKSDDLITLIHALKRPYRKSASFIMNDKTIAQIRNTVNLLLRLDRRWQV